MPPWQELLCKFNFSILKYQLGHYEYLMFYRQQMSYSVYSLKCQFILVIACEISSEVTKWISEFTRLDHLLRKTQLKNISKKLHLCCISQLRHRHVWDTKRNWTTQLTYSYTSLHISWRKFLRHSISHICNLNSKGFVLTAGYELPYCVYKWRFLLLREKIYVLLKNVLQNLCVLSVWITATINKHPGLRVK